MILHMIIVGSDHYGTDRIKQGKVVEGDVTASCKRRCIARLSPLITTGFSAEWPVYFARNKSLLPKRNNSK